MRMTPLLIETNYAMTGSTIRIKELILKAVDYGYGSLAIADSRLYGAIKFYKACMKNNIKPIIGLSVVTEGIFPSSRNTFVVYAKNNMGYTNLLKLASISSEHVVTLEQLQTYKEGIVGVLLSDRSELMGAYQNNQKNTIGELKEMLENHFEDAFVSLSVNDEFNSSLKKEFAFVAMPRIQYLNQEDNVVSDTLKQIFQKQANSMLDDEQSNHFGTVEEYSNRYSSYPEAVENTSVIADMCNVVIDFSTTHLPSYVKKEVSSKDYLEALAIKGLEKRLKGKRVDKKQYIDRLQYELGVIDSMGYNDYFLIVWDFVKYAKKNKYLVGPGRGSAAASLVSWCLGITSVDSLEYNLVFERFLNPERITLPDIDMDLPDDKRDDIIQYVRDLYGKHRVSSICTFGTFLKKSAIRDTARIVGVEGILLDQIIKETSKYNTVRELLDDSAVIKNIISQQPHVNTMLQIASRIEGLHRHVSTHAAGIIVTEDDMTNHTAVQPGLLNMMQTQYEAKDLEELGLLKIDFLGLRNLTSINRITDLIEEKENTTIDVYRIPLDDKKTFDLLKRVEVTGLFQLESGGMRKLIGDMQIAEFEDIVSVLALFRPGPMENIPAYLRRRFGKEQVTYPHPVIKEVLQPTNGIIIYQEQIIQIASLFAGYSPGEADLLRRAVSKKQENVLQEERSNFMKKARQLNRDDNISNEIYDYIVKFANYGFNRAHSVAYAMVSYWMAYLKANYPKYFIGVLTSSVIGSESHMREYIFEASKLGVSIQKPSINTSTTIFEPEGNNLIYPLLGIKHVGHSTIKDLVEERQKGLFTSFYDFVKRCEKIANKRVIESLIYAGALDEFGLSKRSMVEQLEEVINFTMYGDFIEKEEFVLQALDEYDFETLQEKEKQVLGFNLFVNPLHAHQEYIAKHNLLTPSAIGKEHFNKEVKFVGIITSIRNIKTKNNKDMAFITIQDDFVKITGVLFTSTFATFSDQLVKNSIYLFKGKVEERGRDTQVVINNLHNLSL